MYKKAKRKLFILVTLFILFSNYIFANTQPEIYSKSAIAIDAESGAVLVEKNSLDKVYPASVTKILTAILALENLTLTDSVVATKTALQIPWDSSSVYIQEGEILTVNDLLYCLLLNSGNDAANVLGEAVSGSLTDFVKLMNEKANELGCTGSNFVNAHGYSNKNHYTTALDMAKIFKYCISNEDFVKIISTKKYVVEPTNKTSEKRYLVNTNRLIETKKDSIYARPYEYAIGGKTGYTEEAGKTFVALAKKEDKSVIVASFNGGTIDGQDARYTDAINLFEYSFNNYTKQEFAKSQDYTFSYINAETKLKYTMSMESDLKALTSPYDNADISYVVSIDEAAVNKIAEFNGEPKNKIIGNITFTIKTSNENLTISKNLVLSQIQKYETATKNTIWSVINIALIIMLVIISTIAYILFRKIKFKSRPARGSRAASRTVNRKYTSI